jgi:hypothetical protein
MTRYALAAGIFLIVGSPALAQTPISGAFPPWAPPSPPQGSPPFPPAPSILQPAPPYVVPVPSGQPMIGYYKMDAYLVGGRCFLPYDSGEFNLAGLAGNARYFGVFEITMPAPVDADPRNASVSYCVICKKRR